MNKGLFQHFWHKQPALLYGLSIFFGFSMAIRPSGCLIIPLSVIFTSGFDSTTKTFFKRFTFFLLMLIASFVYGKTYYVSPDLPQKGIIGQALFSIDSISTSKVLFGKKWVYKGRIKSFTQENKSSSIAKNLPITLTLHHKKSLKRPLANQSYIIEGRLLQSESNFPVFLLDYKKPWLPVKNSYSFAEFRFNTKQKIIQIIQKNIRDKKCCEFLSGLATGLFENRSIHHEFSRYGLQHIMAISGFHFSIIAILLTFCLRIFFKTKAIYWALIFLLSSYFLFLGPTPSIMRAWVMIVIGLAGTLLQKNTTALNSLGVAVCVILFLNPLACINLGFQLSVIITAAILIFHPMFNHILLKIFPIRKYSEVILMPKPHQLAYLCTSFLKQMLTLLFAVNLIALPLSLYFFQTFPLLSLIYNIFFPFLVSLSMFFLLMSFIFYPLHVLFDSLNVIFTKAILNFIYNAPISLDFSLYSSNVSLLDITTYLTVIFYCGILYTCKNHPENQFRFI